MRSWRKPPTACRRYLEAADAMVRLEIRDEAMRSRSPWLAGTLHSELARARTGFRDQAIAARGAADAALGVAEALADYVRSEPGMPVDSEQLVLPAGGAQRSRPLTARSWLWSLERRSGDADPA